MGNTRTILKSCLTGLLLVISMDLMAGSGSYYRTRMMSSGEFDRLKNHFGVYTEGRDYNVIINGHGTGFMPPTEEEWEALRFRPMMVDETPVLAAPPSADHSTSNAFPPVGNQGRYGSCTAWAAGYYTKTFQEATEHGWDLSSSFFNTYWANEVFPDTIIFTEVIELVNNADRIFSPTFVYHQINGGLDEGSSFEDAMNLLYRTGCSTWSTVPVDSTPYTKTDSTSWAGEAGWREAPLYRSKNNYTLVNVTSDAGLETLKQAVSDGHLASIVMDASFFSVLSAQDFFSLNNYTANNFNHANTIVGYDDNYGPYTEQGEPDMFGAFKLVNSWGVGTWENVNDGFYYMSYECMKQRIQYAYFYENELNYDPELIAVFNMDHDTTRGDCLIKFGLGDTLSPTIAKRFNDYKFVSGVTPMSFPSNNMVMDLTEFVPYMSGGANEFFMGVYDRSSPYGGFDETHIGRIDTFYIEFYSDYQSGIPIDTYLSTDPYPVATEDGDSVYAWVVDKDSIAVNPSDTTVTWQDQLLDLAVDAYTSQPLSWTVSVTSGGAWLSLVSPAAGVGDDTMTVHLDENTDLVNPRTGTLQLVCPLATNSPVNVSITQTRAEYTIRVIPDTMDVTWFPGDSIWNVDITGPPSITWSASVIQGASWLSLPYTSSSAGDDTIRVRYDTNTDPVNDRTGIVRFASSSLGVVNSPVDVPVFQDKAEYILSVAPDTIDISFMEGDSSFQVSFNNSGMLDWTADVIGGSSWLSITSGSSGTGGGTINIHYDENPDSLFARTGTIEVVSLFSINDTVQVTVIQDRFWDAMRVLPDTIEADYWSGDSLFHVRTYADLPLDWTASVTSGASWLSITSGATGTGNAPIQVHYDPNYDPVNGRAGTVSVSSAGAINSPCEVTVTQPRGVYTWVVSPDSIAADWMAGDQSIALNMTGPRDLVWTASVIQGGSWLSFNSSSTGRGDGLISMHYDANEDPANNRVGIVRIVSDSVTTSPADIYFYQERGIYTVSIEPDTMNLGWAEGDSTFELSMTGPRDLVWTSAVIQGDSWLQITSGNSGRGAGTIDIHYDINTDPDNDRTGIIRVVSDSADGSPYHLIVNQVKGEYNLSVTPVNMMVSWEANDSLFDVGMTGPMDLDWTASVTSGNSWLSIPYSGSGTGNGTFPVHYDENPDFDSTRVGTIRVNFGSPVNETVYALVTQVQALEFFIFPAGDLTEDVGLSQGVSWADPDGDNDADILVTNGNDINQKINVLYLNNEDHTFTRNDMDAGPSYGTTWGDYNNDGYLDVYITNFGKNYLYRGGEGGALLKVDAGDMTQDEFASRGCAWGDYDRDGHIDLFVANYNNQKNNLYHNNGDGSFTKITEGTIVNDQHDSHGCAWCDYDNDGFIDLFVANYNINNCLYKNMGNGSFDKVVMGDPVNNGGRSLGCSWGDYNNDGYFDLFVTNRNDQDNFLYSNNGNGSFTRQLTDAAATDGGYSYGSTWADFDNDGDVDLFVTNAQNQPNDYYRNDGTGHYFKTSYGKMVTDTHYSYGTASGDYDGDGDLDIFVANYNQPNMLYVNNQQTNHWLKIQCTGFVSNRAAIGARIHVKATLWESPVWQSKEISSQTGYLSQNSQDLVFGLGDAVSADSIRIEWPSGVVWDTVNVAADQMLFITERTNLPVAVNDEASTNENHAVTIDVLQNDSDADGDDLIIESLILTGTQGAVITNTGEMTVTYTPPANFFGSDMFRYVVTDGKNGRDTAQVQITVIPRLNNGPVARDDEASTLDGAQIIIFAVSNDTDPDGDALTIQSLNTTGTSGTVEIQPGDTSIAYTPAGDFEGSDVFTYVVTDGRGGTDTGTVTVSVSITPAPNRAPVAQPDTAATGNFDSIVIDVLANDSDADGDTLWIDHLWTKPTNGTVEINAGDTTVTYHPLEDFTGFDTFYYFITDGHGGTDSALVTIEVTKYSMVEGMPLPTTFHLSQNYPNPFNPETEIQYQLPEKADVNITVYSILGRKVKELINQTHKPGYYRIRWRATDERGLKVPSGIYLMRIQAGSYRAIRKMTLLR